MASLDVRALVAVCLRNSLLEELHASESTLRPAGVGAIVTDVGMPEIIRASIRYWRDVRLDNLDIPPPPAAEDIFGCLVGRYPHAWTVLSHIANTEETAIEFAACPAPRPREPIALALTPTHAVEEPTLSGMASELDPGLAAYLHGLAEGELGYLFSDCWKALSRNPEILWRVIDTVVGNGKDVVTHNYMLTPTSAFSRLPLVRPMHMRREMSKKFANQQGLHPEHRARLLSSASHVLRVTPSMGKGN